ncbi:N-acetyl sugar amidotransferase [Desulfonema magnum]|uniref:Sugar aminotransferase domain-containing protein n=1 Tax=Desulfonema magnum TaxID=45655 RepID=A0A975BZK7_9BACT|nr:N-acetyl sugar amidotransferase [Desulfonema magnum]QTA93892.1 Sugar aminotransferase domain-containing protein [Desulfonema magnum]
MKETGQQIRCGKCVLPHDFPNISFDKNGICNYCLEWDKKWQNFDYDKAEAELTRIVNWAKAKKRKYDCLIPYSGGRDSSYVLYLCKRKYNLNPLAVTFNNLFMSEYAIRNIFNTVSKLDVDHVFLTYQPEIVRKFYKTMVRDGGEFCSVCTSGINYATSKYQKQFNIPLVISGTSTRVDEQSPFEITCTHPVYLRRVLLQNGFSLETINSFLIKRSDEISALEKIKMKLSDSDYIRINLPDFVIWNNLEIQNVLERELDWDTPDKQKDHIDCKFAPVKNFLKNKQIPNFIFKQEKFSQLIRDGQMTREEAVEMLNSLSNSEEEPPAELDEFLNFLELEKKDIENKEKKSHLNYVTKEDLVVKESLAFRLLSVPWQLYKRFGMKIK